MDMQTFLHFAFRPGPPHQSTPQPQISSSFLIENILGLNRVNISHQFQTTRRADSSLKRVRNSSEDQKDENFSAPKSKRVRTIFTADQLERLEEEFAKCQYVVGAEREELARILCLSSNQVKVWFQNRRIKFRKQQQEVYHTALE